MIKLSNILTETDLQTKRGSIIRRYKNNVGKLVGSQLYVHKQYADQIIPNPVWEKAKRVLGRHYPNFQYNAVCFDVKAKTVRFDQASDFDSAREPHVGDYIIVWVDGTRPPQVGHSNNIWHHKWLWVKDDYTGFDVDNSKEWSKIWLSRLNEPAKGTDAAWTDQLKKCGLNESFGGKNDRVVFGGVWSNGRIVANIVDGPDQFFGHTRDMGWNRWTYYENTKIVFWWRYPPDADSQEDVTKWLNRKGFNVHEHRNRGDYYSVMASFLKKQPTNENLLK